MRIPHLLYQDRRFPNYQKLDHPVRFGLLTPPGKGGTIERLEKSGKRVSARFHKIIA